MRSHSWIAASHYDGNIDLIDAICDDLDTAPIGEKLRALLKIADKVRVDGKTVSESDIAAAKEHGATDLEIHDTVLVAAAFSMYNRYVDGLAAWSPDDEEMYETRGRERAAKGYRIP